MFLFACFTGLAYRDVCNLTKKNIVKADDGQPWIKTTRQKTGTPSEIPLLEVPLHIIRKYRGIAKNGKLLPMLGNGTMNNHLKNIGKKCGIEKNLSFHVGRHTFATEITLSQGVPIESVSRMLGHRNLATTRIYAKITDEKLGRDMEQLEQRIGDKYQLVQIKAS
jgi:integrase